MKNLLFTLLALVLVLFTACREDDELITDDTATVEVNFVAEKNGEPLVIGEATPYPGDDRLFQATKFQFYLSDIVLLEDGTADVTELSEVELIDFTASTAEEAALGTSRAYENVPVGTYSGIRMGLGVNRDLNVETTGVYTSSEPLGQNWWPGWESYIFSRFEGRYDVDNDGAFTAADSTYVLHTGSNEAFRTVTLNMPVTVSAENGNTVISITVDYDQVFRNGTDDYHDLEADNTIHNADNLDLINQLMDNFENAFELR